MRPTTAALTALALVTATAAYSQEVQRYVGLDRKAVAVDNRNRLPVSNGPNGDPNAGLDSSGFSQVSGGVALAAKGSFYSIMASVIGGQGPIWIMVFDSKTIPPDGAVSPLRCFYADAGPRTTSLSSAIAIGMDNGISWAASSGPNCQTKVSATVNFVAVSYKAAPIETIRTTGTGAIQ